MSKITAHYAYDHLERRAMITQPVSLHHQCHYQCHYIAKVLATLASVSIDESDAIDCHCAIACHCAVLNVYYICLLYAKNMQEHAKLAYTFEIEPNCPSRDYGVDLLV